MPDYIEAARQLLPAWVLWAPLVLFPLLAFAIALVGSYLAARLSLPWRIPGNTPWYEQARLLHPARGCLAVLLLLLPAWFVFLGNTHGGPLTRAPRTPLALLAGALSAAAVFWVWLNLERRVRPLRWADLLRGVVLMWLVIYPVVPIIGMMVVLVPETPDTTEWLLALALALVMCYLGYGGGLNIANMLGFAQPASERLRGVVARAAERAGLPAPATCELNWQHANAVAFPLKQELAFTQASLELLDDDELLTVAAHELSHLAEPRRVAWARLSPLVFLIPFGLARPLLEHTGGVGLLAAAGLFLIVVIGVQLMARRMEVQADQAATAHEMDAGAYARALEKLYRANLNPMVTGSKHGIHPDLYDRLQAAGLPLDYPRPEPPDQNRAGILITCVAGVAVALPFALVEYSRMIVYEEDVDEQVLLWSIVVNGGEARTLGLLAEHRQQRGDRQAAASFYLAAAQLDDLNLEYPANAARALAELGRCDEAAAALEEALARQPITDMPLVIRAVAHEPPSVRAARAALERCRQAPQR